MYNGRAERVRVCMVRAAYDHVDAQWSNIPSVVGDEAGARSSFLWATVHRHLFTVQYRRLLLYIQL